MPSLVVQLSLKDKPDLVPIGVSLNLFAQFLGASVLQVIAGAIFTTYLKQRLAEVGLGANQIALLLAGGTLNVRKTTLQCFPDMFNQVMDAYNYAITRTFVSLHRTTEARSGASFERYVITEISQFIPVAGACITFVLGLSIKWQRIIKVEKKSQEDTGLA